MKARRIVLSGLLAGLFLTMFPASPAQAAVMTFTPSTIASGISWNTGYNCITSDGAFEVGTYTSTYQSSGQLRFNLAALNGLYSSINSVTIELTSDGSWAGRATNTMSAYALTVSDSGSDTGWTWGSAWAGGAKGATVATTDYVTPALGSELIAPQTPRALKRAS